ncbi:MAG: CrcB family protein [Actinomycetota bacterium]|nr:CrcB family protein [Actinomycetota bacterium]
MITAALFAAFAAVGAVARAEVSHRWNRPGGTPYGTLAVNLVGSFLLGLLWNISPPWLTVLAVGGLGTFTTFSTFAREVVALAERRQVLTAAAYLTVSCTGAVAAAAFGVALVG